MKHDPLQNKSKRKVSKQGVHRKQTKIFHTLAQFDQVASLVSSWIRSLAWQHHVAQVSLMLILPKALQTRHRVGNWGSFKILWWGNKYHFERSSEPSEELCLSLQKFQNSKIRSKKREEWVMQSQNCSTLNLRRQGGKLQAPQVKHG
jgi:hypothetical protein